MEKGISFSGLQHSLSDYEVPDGTLDVSLNLINEGGSLKPLGRPGQVYNLQSDGLLFVPLVVHRNLDYYHIILQYTYQTTDSEGNSVYAYALYWAERDPSVSGVDTLIVEGETLQGVALMTTFTADQIPDAAVDTLLNITAQGNMLIVVTNDGLYYLRWGMLIDETEDHYIDMGLFPDLTPIQFALNVHSEYSIDEKLAKVIIRREDNEDETTDDYNAYETAAANSTEEFCAQCNSVLSLHKDRFYYPFFVRYCFRLYDGSCVKLSPTLLMLPSIYGNPILKGFRSSKSSNTVWNRVEQTYDSYYLVQLYWQHYFTSADLLFSLLGLSDEHLQKLRLWRDVIQSIDIFVSPQIYTYDQSAVKFDPSKHWLNVVPEALGYTTYYGMDMLQSMPLAIGFQNQDFVDPKTDSDNIILNPLYENSDTYQAVRQNTVLETTDSETDSYIGNTEVIDASPRTSCGVITETDVYDWKAGMMRYFVFAPTKSNTDIVRELTETSSFYLYSSIDIGDLLDDDGLYTQDAFAGALSGFYRVHSDVKDITAISTREALSEDSLDNSVLVPKIVSSYNGRIHLGCITEKLGYSYSLDMHQAYSTSVDTYSVKKAYFLIEKEGKRALVEAPSDEYSVGFDSDQLIWFYTPNEYVTKVYLYYKKNATSSYSYGLSKVQLTLTKHSTLSGAYCFNNFAVITEGITYSELPDVDVIDDYKQAEMYVSEVDNPFYFPSANAVSIGSGDLVAISGATAALSEGQFGAFPLYAFTTEGVWALELGGTGVYNSVQPVTRDVALSGTVLPLTSSIIFLSERGVMQIHGSTVKCLSDDIRTRYDTDLFNAPAKLSSLVNVLLSEGGWSEDDYAFLPLQEYLQDAGLTYDHINQRIVLFHPDQSYAYVYSLATGVWGQVSSRIRGVLNDYPNCLAWQWGTTPKSDDNSAAYTQDNGSYVTRTVNLTDTLYGPAQGEPYACEYAFVLPDGLLEGVSTTYIDLYFDMVDAQGDTYTYTVTLTASEYTGVSTHTETWAVGDGSIDVEIAFSDYTEIWLYSKYFGYYRPQSLTLTDIVCRTPGESGTKVTEEELSSGDYVRCIMYGKLDTGDAMAMGVSDDAQLVLYNEGTIRYIDPETGEETSAVEDSDAGVEFTEGTAIQGTLSELPEEGDVIEIKCGYGFIGTYVWRFTPLVSSTDNSGHTILLARTEEDVSIGFFANDGDDGYYETTLTTPLLLVVHVDDLSAYVVMQQHVYDDYNTVLWDGWVYDTSYCVLNFYTVTTVTYVEGYVKSVLESLFIDNSISSIAGNITAVTYAWTYDSVFAAYPTGDDVTITLVATYEDGESVTYTGSGSYGGLKAVTYAGSIALDVTATTSLLLAGDSLFATDDEHGAVSSATLTVAASTTREYTETTYTSTTTESLTDGTILTTTKTTVLSYEITIDSGAITYTPTYTTTIVYDYTYTDGTTSSETTVSTSEDDIATGLTTSWYSDIVDFNDPDWNFDSDDIEQGIEGILVSRPLKLGAPNILKTMRRLIIRGAFERGQVRVMLYGSRDLLHWFPIKSSVDQYVRPTVGTPYTYFRIVVLPCLRSYERLYGADMAFDTKETNQIR